MKLADLSPERRAWLARACWDRIIEKHEGPEDWRWELEHDGPPADRVEFLTLDGYEVLLPVPSERHLKISPLWIIPSGDGRVLTIYLTDMQYAEWYSDGEEWSHVGFVAICERAPDADWYVAILYHEAFLDANLTPVRLPPWPTATGETEE